MKSFFVFIVMALSIVFMQTSLSGTAEAAWVAIVPIEINDAKVARASDFNNYYWDIMIERLRYPEYDLIEDAKIEATLPYEGLKSFDQKTLADICDKTNAELVIAMRLDNVHSKVDRSNREPKTKCYMKGLFAGYNRLTGKYYYKKINYVREIETVLTLKNDWQYNAFTSTLKRCLNQMLEGKKEK